jgi:hypothetical protein
VIEHPPLAVGTRVRLDAGHHVTFGKILEVSDAGISIAREEEVGTQADGYEVRMADTFYPWSRVHYVRRAER